VQGVHESIDQRRGGVRSTIKTEKKINCRTNALVCRGLELARRFFRFPLEFLQPVILRLYLLFPLEQRLLELLVLRLRNFCTLDRSVCLGTKRGEFLFFFFKRYLFLFFRRPTKKKLNQFSRVFLKIFSEDFFSIRSEAGIWGQGPTSLILSMGFQLGFWGGGNWCVYK
jgi:hypothetical protein